MKWLIVIVIVLAIFSNSNNVNRLGSSSVTVSEGVNNTFLLPQDDPRSKTLLRTVVVVVGIAWAFGAFKKKEEPKKEEKKKD